MKRLGSALAGAVVVLVVALPVSANAPGDQYNTFYDDLVITDSKTGLEWDRTLAQTPYAPPATFAKATSDCAAEGKRLPSLKELLTIVDEAPYYKYVDLKNEPRYIDFNAFDNTPSDAFWTSSLLVGSDNKAYTVDFKEGTVDQAGLTDSRNVRCVK